MTNIIIKAPCFPLHVPQDSSTSSLTCHSSKSILWSTSYVQELAKFHLLCRKPICRTVLNILHNLGHVPKTVSPYSTRIDCWADHHLILLSSPPNIGEVSPPPPARLLFITTRTFVCTFCISLVYLHSTLAII